MVNYEDHLKIVVLPDKSNPGDSLREGLNRCFKLIKTFEKLGYATDTTLGNLTVSPQNLGTALKLNCSLKIDASSEKKVSGELI